MALKLGPALLVLVSFAAIFLGTIFYGISINELQYRNPPASHFKKDVVIGDQLDNNLLWFLQVTDLHLSNHEGNQNRTTDFVEFSSTYLDIFKPDAVLVTGDITDARSPNTSFGTGQNLDEWQAYWDAITKTDAVKKTKWMDIRGNHDNFNVYRPQNPDTPYRKFTVMGKKHSRNYYEVVEKGTGSDAKRYTFIGVDEVQTPGLKIFNFLGVVKSEDLNELKSFKDIAKRENSDYTIWFAHYPTSSIASPKEGLRGIIDGPYLCGHFHTTGNWVTKMQASQQSGYAEVELGDWKYNRRIRLAAVDHQLFNFVDFKFKEFPVALMTNPKNPQYSMPKFEPSDRIRKSTHIRVLAFSNASSITSVTLSIDGSTEQPLQHSTGPLWVLKWSPDEYKNGLHKAEIHVEDSSGVRRTYEQTFSLDDSKEEYSLGARILLRSYFRTNMIAVFFFIVAVCVLPLLLLRFVFSVGRQYQGTFLYDLHLLSSVRRLFVPLLIIPLWIAIGPLCIGYLVDDALGACFAWGVLTDGTFVHTAITYNVASVFLLFVHIPEIVLLTSQVGSSHESLQTYSPVDISRVKIALHAVVTFVQLYMGFMIYSAHGALAFFTSFPYLWCVFFYAYCWYQCNRLEKSDFIGSRP